MSRLPKSFLARASTTALLLTLATAASAQQAQPAPAAKTFTEAELAALLAPIALYPDTVVAQILMASTYPIEVIQARRWLEKNKDLKGDAVATAVQKQEWDDSVKSLVAAPEVLKMMDENLAWMQKLGDAFLAQQKDTFDMVQTLRSKAMKEGNLKSDDHMKVSTQAPPAPAEGAPVTASGDTEVIIIESASPEVVYVPTYNPTTAYGYWGYPAYPPYYWPPPMGYPGSGFWWGMGIGIAIGGAWGGCCWGGGDVDIDWNGGDINIGGDRGQIGDGNRGDRVNQRDRSGRTGDRAGAGQNRAGGQKWSHNPQHRKGVSYRDNATASKFGDRSSNRAASRDAFRGRSSDMGSRAGAGSRDFNAGRTGTGTRDIGSGSRPSSTAGARDRGTGSRPSTSNRGSSGRSSSSYGGSRSRGSSSAFGGMSSGSRAGSYGSRGGGSRGGMRGGGGGRRR